MFSFVARRGKEDHMMYASLSEGGCRGQSLAELFGDIFVLNKVPFSSSLELGGKLVSSWLVMVKVDLGT